MLRIFSQQARLRKASMTQTKSVISELINKVLNLVIIGNSKFALHSDPPEE